MPADASDERRSDTGTTGDGRDEGPARTDATPDGGDREAADGGVTLDANGDGATGDTTAESAGEATAESAGEATAESAGEATVEATVAGTAEDDGTAVSPSRGATGSGRATATDGTAPAIVGDDLQIGYATTEEPVVTCEKVTIPAGEITALVGPNGSGKSTLLKTMADQHEPDCGQVLLDGEEVQSLDPKRLARTLGLLAQQNQAPDSLTVRELAMHGRYPHRGFFEAVGDEDRAAVDRALALAGVEHLADAEMGALSGGQRQLAWIAMVLAQETDVLLLDEPTTFLDLHHQLRVMEVVRTLNEEAAVTVGIVLHDLGQAARFADNLIAMADGALYDWGPPTEVVTERLLADVFDVDATVDTASPGGPHIAPHRPLDR